MADLKPEKPAENGADEKADPVQEAEDLKMSRGPRKEADVNFEKLKELYVYDELGNKIRFSDVYRKQKTIIVMTRHLLDFITKEYVEDLAIIPLEYLQEAETRLVVIGPAPFKFIKPFRKVTNYQYTMYCDPDGELYKAMGCMFKMACGPLDKCKHVKSGVISGFMKSMWRAMQYQEYQGDPKQQGASFIMGPGDVVHFSHIDESASDHVDINDLLEAAGVQKVSFPKDQRVLTV
ncbi:hypothetical protein BaRGS_00000386 [Batillaria attramentaria]|uniref:Uncharacterized protein n=1 Tax=Batillaria attramentaria TaxID=370345 RepID=A0ABD0M9A9_9CAEN